MRELERDPAADDPASRPSEGLPTRTLAIVGRGRLGTALAEALAYPPLDLPGGPWRVTGPHGRGFRGEGDAAVLLCVPDREIAGAASLIRPGPLVGHCSGACPLDVLRPHEAFSLHPLMTVVPGRANFAGAGAAVAGSTDRAQEFAVALARALGMRCNAVSEDDRTAYHAAASIASNFLVTLQAAAEQVARTAGVERELLAPLVRASLENWIEVGGERALTGPVARGDEETVAAQRVAIAERAPDLLPLFDSLADATRALAGRGNAHATRARAGSEPQRPMKIARTISDVRGAVREARLRGDKVGLVPTMGAFHAGHLSLMRRARAECDVVVVSLFINPAQFSDPADLRAYPRDERADAALAADAGVDLVFAPAPDEIYPDAFATRVSVGSVAETLEGAHRGPEHFDAVCTVVCKLLNIVGPDVAYFGQKDAQQAAVVKQLVRDLDVPVSVEVCPTVRAPDGLALSSRNVRLSREGRGRATGLYRALQVAQRVIASGERDPHVPTKLAWRELRSSGIEPEYLELVDPDTFLRAPALTKDVLAVVAASLDGVRLIDNLLIEVPGPHEDGPRLAGREAPSTPNTNVAATKRAREPLARSAV